MCHASLGLEPLLPNVNHLEEGLPLVLAVLLCKLLSHKSCPLSCSAAMDEDSATNLATTIVKLLKQ